MAKGVKKIQWTGQGKVFQKMSNFSSRIVIPPNEFVWFKVSEWLPDTTLEDKKKDISWIWQEQDRKVIIWKKIIPSNQIYAIKLPKKLCGSYSYYLEASLSGKTDPNITGLYINGLCDKKIVSSKWATSNGGEDVRKSYVFSYGNIIHLNLSTEGLNGDRLIVEIYNIQTLRSDKLIFTFTNVKVRDGEVNLEIKNTSTWQGLVNNIQDEEKFYIKVKDQATGKYIVDNNNDEEHARFLRIKNKLVANNPQPPQNNTAAKTGQPNVSAVRYEPCKFDTISITETQKKEGKMEKTTTLIFDKGKGLKDVANPQKEVTKTIFFGFDSDIITKEGNEKLNNTLNFLLEHEHSTITIDGYACVIGKMEYNKSLSQKRSDAVKKFFIDGKLDPRRIISTGKGEINASDNKSGADNLKYKDEKIYVEARRVDISFKYFSHTAATIIYETIVPSHDKDILFDITGFQTDACFRDKDKHKKEVKVTSSEYKTPLVKSGSSVVIPVHSALSTWNVAPLQYIWPKWNLIEGITGNGVDSAEKYNVFIHSCRYFSEYNNATVLMKAYPDIKWTLTFFLNLTNELSVKWQNQPETKVKEFQKKAGKIGAEKRWEQKDASFGFSLKGEWDKNDNGTFIRNKEFKAEYETKFKKLYSLFSSLGAISEGITSKTKGQIRNMGFKGLPMTIAVKPPNLNIKGVWSLEKTTKKNNTQKVIGTNVDISFNADPLIGLELTIDLLCTAVGLVAGAVSGGTAAPGAVRLYSIIKGKMNTGISAGNDSVGFKASSDVYIDLIISSVIKTAIGFSFNTENDTGESTKGKLELTNTLKLELKAGIWVKAELSLIVVKADAYFEVSGKGNAAVTFGHKVNYDSKGLIYKPQLGFDGLNAEYVIKGKVGLSSKKTILGTKPKTTDEGVISEGKYNEVIPKFDIIKSLEELFGISAEIPLIKN
ncbi:OmpA family protein [Flavobacterium sp. 9AF]|uniref:OmpA family protein n=1 Tax=Flavobacterium sp. 9AF TaxID=2653142 RepID=UPI0013575358|nr:OmpA family protein [Flavobacterium sp. 9AF]